MPETRPRRPGDLILDRYMPDASEDAREKVRENLRQLAHLMLRLGSDDSDER